MTTNETILSVIPGNTEHERLIVVLRSMQSTKVSSAPSLGLFDPRADSISEFNPSQPSRTFCEELISVRERPVVLRQQSFSPAVGWFTQSEMEMTQDQWAMMRCTVVPPQSRAISQASPAARQLNRLSATELAAGSGPATRRRFDRFTGDDVASVVPFRREQAASA